MKMKKRGRRRGQTTSDKTAGVGMKTREDRKISFGNVGKPGRSTIKKGRTNEGTIEKRKRFRSGPTGRGRN